MAVPVDREGKVIDSTLLRREPTTSSSLEPISTRKAGGRPQNQGTQTVSRLCFSPVLPVNLADALLLRKCHYDRLFVILHVVSYL